MYIVLALFLTILAYMIFPIIYIAINGKTTKKKAHIIALINSIVCGTIFIIILVLLGANAKISSSASSLPAVTYYFINKAILTNKKQEENSEKV